MLTQRQHAAAFGYHGQARHNPHVQLVMDRGLQRRLAGQPCGVGYFEAVDPSRHRFAHLLSTVFALAPSTRGSSPRSYTGSTTCMPGNCLSRRSPMPQRPSMPSPYRACLGSSPARRAAAADSPWHLAGNHFSARTGAAVGTGLPLAKMVTASPASVVQLPTRWTVHHPSLWAVAAIGRAWLLMVLRWTVHHPIAQAAAEAGMWRVGSWPCSGGRSTTEPAWAYRSNLPSLDASSAQRSGGTDAPSNSITVRLPALRTTSALPLPKSNL